MKIFYRCIAAVLLILSGQVAGASGQESKDFVTEGVRIKVEDTRTRVGFASVRLEIGELIIEESRVLGEYKIRIPLRQSKNDDGLINLEFQQDLPTTFKSGGKLKGEGISTTFKEDPPRIITCEILPDDGTVKSGGIVLTIETVERTITFESRYRIVEGKTEAE